MARNTQKLENLVDLEVETSFFDHRKCNTYNIYLAETREDLKDTIREY